MPGLALPSLIGIALFTPSKKLKFWAIVIAALLSIQTFFTYGRAHWFGVAISCFVFCLLLPSDKRRIILRNFIALSLVIIFIMLIICQIKYGSALAFTPMLKERITYGASESLTGIATLNWRLLIAKGYMRIIKNRPIFGLGFLHDRYAYMIPGLPFSMVRNTHVGFLNIFIDLGIVGSILLIMLFVIFIKHSLYIIRNLQNKLYKILSIGLISAFLGRLAAFTLDTFSTYEGVTIIAVLMGLQEVMYDIDKKEIPIKK